MECLDALEEFLRVLSDGKTRKIEDMARRLGWPQRQVEGFCELVSEHELIYYDRNDRSVRIDKGLRKLIHELDKI